jgi:hypothetical protein
VDVPLLGGRSLDPAILGLVFGVILTAYFGHLSVSTCARVVLQRDPSARSLIWGTAAAQATAILLYCLFVLAVNGAIAPRALNGARGTALDPLAAEIGPIVYLLGSVFVVLGMGMGSIHYALALFNLVRERLPSLARPVVVLPRRRGVLLFRERGRGGAGASGLRLGLVYLGLGGGKARFRLDVQLDGDLRRVETIAAAGRWEVLGEKGDPALLDLLSGPPRSWRPSGAGDHGCRPAAGTRAGDLVHAPSVRGRPGCRRRGSGRRLRPARFPGRAYRVDDAPGEGELG